MNLKDEFFNNFIGVDKNTLLYVINNLTPEQKRMLNEVYGKDVEVINNTTRKYIMNIIFKDLYKKPLKDYLATSPENILSLVNTLKDFERNTLLKEYTIDIIEPIEILTIDEIDRNKKTIKKLKEAVRKRRFNLSRKKSLENYKLFFDTFAEDKETVLKVLDALSDDEITLLKKRFGNDYSSLYPIDEDSYEKIKLSIYPKIKRWIKLVKEGANFVSIYDFVDDTKDLEVIKSRVLLLDKFGRNTIYKLFGNNLDKLCIISADRKNNLIRKEYLLVLNGKASPQKKNDLITIFDRYRGDNETDEDFLKRINLALSSLDKYDRYLFNRKYLHNEHLSKIENQRLRYVIYGKIKSRLIGDVLDIPMCKGLFERFNKNEKNVVLYYIDKLFNDKEKDLLRKKFGDDFTGVSYLYEDIDNYAIQKMLQRIENRLLMDYKEKLNKEVKIDGIRAFRTITRSEEYNELRYIYGDVLALAILLYVRYSGKVSFDEIEKLTGIKQDDVLKYSEEYLNSSRGR